jgi:uncharacterized protein YqgQ
MAECDENEKFVDNPEKSLGPEDDDCSKEVGPKLASPPRDGIRFVVKVHNSKDLSPSYGIILYDRNREFSVRFSSKVIEQLLKEFGVLCPLGTTQKELFLHCLCKDNGQLRLFTNEFAEFQNW